MKDATTILGVISPAGKLRWMWGPCCMMAFLFSAIGAHGQAVSSYPWVETFDSYTAGSSSVGLWVQDQNDHADWLVNTGATPGASTGPSSDHTTGSGNYIYLNSSFTNANELANLLSPSLDLNGLTNPKFEFWYHMFGATVSTLNVHVDAGAGWMNVWSKAGDQGNQWKRGDVDLSPYLSASSGVQVRLQAEAGAGTTGDIAIDDVKVFAIAQNDTIAPEISLVGEDTATVEVFSPFLDPGIHVKDNFYSASTLVVFRGGTWSGHAEALGEYTIEYTARDPSGNTSTIVRIIQVVDTEAPDIQLRGSEVVHVARCSTYDDPGVEIEDNYYPDDSITIEAAGDIDLSGRIDSPGGTYYVSYQALDPSGNRSEQLIRYIQVGPDSGPCSSVSGGEPLAGIRWEIRPNPAHGQFTLQLKLAEREQVRISVLNGVGEEVQVVEEATLQSAQYEVDLTGHRSGLYFVRVQTEEGVMVKKVLLQR